MEEILTKLISFHSTSDDLQGRHEAIEYIAHFVSKRGMHTSRYEWDGHEALVATVTPNVKKVAVLLAAHVDVVPGDDDMFALQKANGKLYGRGVFDMKFAIAAYLAVIDELQERLHEYDIGIMITSDEEIGGKNGIDGTERLIREGYMADMVILPDGGRNWQLEESSKGVVRYKFEAKGKAGHASRPWEGESAITKLINLLHELQQRFVNQKADTDTFNIGEIAGGVAPNIIPDFATANIEIRLNEPSSLKQQEQNIGRLCQVHDVSYSREMLWNAVINDMTNSYVTQFAQCIEAVTGIKSGSIKSLGGSDARFFAERGIPYASTYLPGSGLHSADEWIEEKALYQFKEVLSQYLDITARSKAPSIKNQQIKAGAT